MKGPEYLQSNVCYDTVLYLFLLRGIYMTEHSNALTNFCNVISPLANSDHKGIHMQCNWRLTAHHNCANTSQGRVVWCYNQADWERAMVLIDSFDWASLFSTDVNESLTKWCEQFLNSSYA